MIHRLVAEKNICNHLHKGKIILLFGARQVGKTTMLEDLTCIKKSNPLYLNSDEADVKEMLTNTTSVKLKQVFANHKVIVIDEAQEIENIGTTLKIIADKIKGVQVIATGSSAFELANRSNEPLTGRKFEFQMFPLTFAEMVKHHGYLEETRMLERRLIFGYYPEIVTNEGNERILLKQIANSYLYKDIFRLGNIRKSALLEKIIQALALQIGSEVSYHEIAQLCGTNGNTVEQYIDVLEKAYIIFKLPSYSKNVRNEIKKRKKIYFWDNGIRNAVIGNYNIISSLRTDVGALWENFLVSERMKMNRYFDRDAKCYFWRTTQQQEIDFIEKIDDKIFAYEFKWNKKAKARMSKTFENTYHPETFQVINPGNIEEFLLFDA
jgi:predicted AAA+ superfamily ATPase